MVVPRGTDKDSQQEQEQVDLARMSFSLPMEVPHEIWLCLAKRFRRRGSLKSVDDDGSWVYYKLTRYVIPLLMS